MNRVFRKFGEKVVDELAVAFVEVLTVQNGIETKSDEPSLLGNFVHRPDPGMYGRYSLFERFADLGWSEAECGYNVG